MSNGLVHTASSEETPGQCIARVCVVGLDSYCCFRMRNCVVDTIVLEKKAGETGVRDIVVRRNGECVSPERFAVTPVAVLNPDLHDADYRHKHSEVPEPTGNQVSVRFTESEH